MDWFQHGVVAEVCSELLKERLSSQKLCFASIPLPVDGEGLGWGLSEARAEPEAVRVAGLAPATALSVGFSAIA
jgi:hypothetical protein